MQLSVLSWNYFYLIRCPVSYFFPLLTVVHHCFYFIMKFILFFQLLAFISLTHSWPAFLRNVHDGHLNWPIAQYKTKEVLTTWCRTEGREIRNPWNLLLARHLANSYTLYGWVCFRHAIGQFAVRNLLYGPKFLKKMLISEL